MEYGAELVTRSYPISAILNAKLGYGWTLWGATGDDAVMYGYLKPELKVSTLGSYNSGLLQVQVFPISFLGFIVGAETVSSSANYPAYDCVTYRCTGKSWQTFVEANLVLGVGPVFLIGRAGVEDWHQAPDQDRDFINSNYGLALKQQGDRVSFAGGVTGYKLDEEWMILYSYMWLQAHEIKGQSQTNLALVQWSSGDWKLLGGVGSFESELKNKQTTVFLRLKWNASGPSPHGY